MVFVVLVRFRVSFACVCLSLVEYVNNNNNKG